MLGGLLAKENTAAQALMNDIVNWTLITVNILCVAYMAYVLLR